MLKRRNVSMDTVDNTPLMETGNKQQNDLSMSSIVEVIIFIGCYGNYYHGDFQSYPLENIQC